jgi:E3 ubiquitin-protein ligase RNFT1
MLCTSLKAAAIACLPAAFPTRAFSSTLDFVTVLLYAYRIALPLPLWLYFFSHIEGAPTALTYIFPSLYLLPKLGVLAMLISTAFKLVQRVYTGDLGYGKRVTLAADDDTVCSICHDTLNSPVRLTCNHLYCEACIATWLAKEKTCPMCRATLPNTAPMRVVPALAIVWH